MVSCWLTINSSPVVPVPISVERLLGTDASNDQHSFKIHNCGSPQKAKT
jgi:hypothetical protein